MYIQNKWNNGYISDDRPNLNTNIGKRVDLVLEIKDVVKKYSKNLF